MNSVLTEENKRRFFLTYDFEKLYPEHVLELRKISSLTDEEFIKLSEIRGSKCERYRDSYYDDKLGELFSDDNRARSIGVNTLMHMRDYLRSIGVFCGFMGIPESDIIEAGWFRYENK